ncbi:MAG: DNA gyrase subunit A [Patescibacteria group bacterium]|nr:DNA gyrase subunit A [Patescibacteria group bacterium]
MSVIVARALPDVRDGLKPVHRRILYAMSQMNLTPQAKFIKCAKIVGETMGKYHPHGNMAIYDALVRLAQDFSLRYPLVWGQGNFGSVDGDPPAADRYTEAKLKPIAMEMIADIDKDTVDFVPTYDDSDVEPLYLPAKIPNLLLKGEEGIAVGMATKIPTHNLKEVCTAIIETIKKGRVVVNEQTYKEEIEKAIQKINLIAEGKEQKTNTIRTDSISFESDITIDELMEIIKGPDFPTGGAIYDAASLKDVYATGRGKIVVRGIAEIVEGQKGKTQIIISEIPYQVNKADLVATIANLAKDKKIVGIADLRDESDKEGLRIAIDLKRDAKPKSVLNNIYKHTKLQTTFPANFVALVDGVPHTLNLKQILVEYIKHRQKVVTRRTIFDLTEAKKRSHILEGYKIALDHLDEVIQTIRSSQTQEDAKINLIAKFGFSEIQAISILDMQLRRLAALEREKIENEYNEIKKLIDKLVAILENPTQVLEIIASESSEIKEKYKDERKTRIYKSKIGEFSEQDLVPKEEVLITVTKTGYIKRVPRATYRSQARGGKGVTGMTTKEEDEIEHLISATSHDTILFFTDKGKVYGAKAWEIAEGSRQSKGQAIVNIINLEQGEKIMSILPLNEKGKYLVMATKKGTIKKTAISEFANMRASGLIAIKLDQNDSLVSVHETSGEDHILMITKLGQSIRFPESNVRPMGRSTSGVTGISLLENDSVIGMEVFPVVEPTSDNKKAKLYRQIMTISEKGMGKRTPINLFPIQKRAGKGVRVATISAKTGPLAAEVMITQDTEQVVITSKAGVVIKLPIKDIPELGRSTQGVILMRFAKSDDSVAAIAALSKGNNETN